MGKTMAKISEKAYCEAFADVYLDVLSNAIESGNTARAEESKERLTDIGELMMDR